MIGAMDAQALLSRGTWGPSARAAAALHQRPAQARPAARRQHRSRAGAVVVTASAAMPTVGIIYYSTYGHVRTLAQVPELLPAEVLEKMGAPPKSDDPVIDVSDLPKFDGLLFSAMPCHGPAELMGDNSETHGGTPYGCGAIVNLDGSRMPSQLELDMAVHQGKYFAGVVKRLAASPTS